MGSKGQPLPGGGALEKIKTKKPATRADVFEIYEA